MTNTEMKKYLKNMDPASLQGLLLEMYKNQPKERREVFEITVVNYNEGKELPARDAAIPDLKKLQKKLEYVVSKTLCSFRYIRPAGKRKIREYLGQIQTALMQAPFQAKDFDKVCSFLLIFLVTVQQIHSDPSLYYLNVYNMVKGDEDSLFRSVLTKYMSGGLNMERLKQLAEFARMPHIEHHDKALHFMEILLSLFKVGDVRFEFMEQLESMLEARRKSAEPDVRSHDSFMLIRTALLYLLCAEQELGYSAALQELKERTSETVSGTAVRIYEDWKKKTEEEEKLRMSRPEEAE